MLHNDNFENIEKERLPAPACYGREDKRLGMELNDEILLAIPDDCSMQPHKLEGGASKANINAIRRLCAVSGISSSKYLSHRRYKN